MSKWTRLIAISEILAALILIGIGFLLPGKREIDLAVGGAGKLAEVGKATSRDAAMAFETMQSLLNNFSEMKIPTGIKMDGFIPSLSWAPMIPLVKKYETEIGTYAARARQAEIGFSQVEGELKSYRSRLVLLSTLLGGFAWILALSYGCSGISRLLRSKQSQLVPSPAE